jgi:hypothetical protein
VEPGSSRGAAADGFFEAYLRRPEAYLDEEVRRGISVWSSVAKTLSNERCAVSAMTSHLAGGLNATVTYSTSTPPNSSSVWSSPEAGVLGHQFSDGSTARTGDGGGRPVELELCVEGVAAGGGHFDCGIPQGHGVGALLEQ